jgi:SAM-dependent methyltransferase
MVTSQRHAEYDNWAWLYNQTMGAEYSDNQIRPLKKLLLDRLPESVKLLDLCCGTGHLSQRLLQKGYLVTGLDSSEAMLRYAQQNAPGAGFVLGDARSLHLPDRFNAVCCMSASLNHMMSLFDLKLVFESVYASLENNGWFLFDLNHPGQMQKWWVGNVVEGEIHANYAWLLTPFYDAETATGYFQVTIFQAQTRSPQLSISQVFKRIFYQVLALRLLTRFRLQVLSQFQAWQPGWQRSENRYSVRGYPESEVRSALQSAGFTDITITTLDGTTPVDNNHSSYFLCRKPHSSPGGAL